MTTRFTSSFSLLSLSLVALSLLIAGCSKAPAPAPPEAVVEEETMEADVVEATDDTKATDGPALEPATDPATDPAPATGETTDPAAAVDSATDEVTAAFASLSEPDRTAALAQKICPVSDEPLGSMGTPLKVTVEGRDVFLCCEGCKKALEEDPQKFLAKLTATK
jgi:hypothetical protein